MGHANEQYVYSLMSMVKTQIGNQKFPNGLVEYLVQTV
jgi:hypothetical protein